MSTAFNLPSFSVTEVDDMMEVSSEHGQNAGDEDIDIDLDLSASHADEDYMLEDAGSNIGMEDDFQPQLPLATGNDQLMFDEDEGQYQANNDDLDAEFALDQAADSMEQEAIAMSFINATSSGFQSGENQTVENTTSDNTLQEEPLELGKTEEIINSNTEIANSSILPEGLPKAGENHEVADALQSSSHSTSCAPSPPNDLSTHTDQIKSSPKTGPGTPEEGIPQTATEFGPSYIFEESEQTEDIGKNLTDLLSREAIVVYQSSEYALFSDSESDDPDSFFLSDLSILEKPLASFFGAIRDVIHEDLADDDELCIGIEDLGVDIMEEIAAVHQDFTFGQILILRSKLLQNDKLEFPGPLYLHLGTKPNFFKRFSRLSEFAAEGKGLSEVVCWDNNQDSPDEQDVEDDRTGEGLILETNEEVDHEIHTLTEHPFNSSLSQDLARGTNDEYVSDVAELPVPIQAISGADSETSTERIAVEDSIKHDDGDLIDYSDEEQDSTPHNKIGEITKLPTDSGRTRTGIPTDFISPCLKPDTCFCSKCNELLLEEYQVKNEELRRRSLSLTAVDGVLDQEAEQTGTLDMNNDGHAEISTHNESQNFDDDSDELQKGEEGADHSDLEHEGSITDNDGTDQIEVVDENHSDGWHIDKEEKDHDESPNLSEEPEHLTETLDELDAENYYPDTQNGDGVFDDGIEFVEEDFIVSDDYLDINGGDISTNHETALDSLSNTTKMPIEIGHEALDSAELETVGSDKTLEALLDDENEINYDEDVEERENTPELVTRIALSKTKDVSIPKAGSGKRQRPEEGSDESFSMSEAKRSRS